MLSFPPSPATLSCPSSIQLLSSKTEQNAAVVCAYPGASETEFTVCRHKGNLPESLTSLRRTTHPHGKFIDLIDDTCSERANPGRIEEYPSCEESGPRKAFEKTSPLDRAIGLDSKRLNFALVASLLRRFGETKTLSEGRRLHDYLSRDGFDRNTFLGNCLIRMYGQCGSLQNAREVFERIDHPDLYSWNTLITACAQNGYLDDARTLFDRMPERDVVSWSALIAAYAHIGNGKQALDLFHKMHLHGVEPNPVTFLSVLEGCTSMARSEEGQKIHAAIIYHGYEKDIVVATALINMYGRCGYLLSASSVFGRMTQRDVVSWNAMIAVCVQNNQGKKALMYFHQMQLEDIKPNRITFICALDACASLAALKDGQDIHATISNSNYEDDVLVGNALVNMYGKCGSIHNSWIVFHNIAQRDVVSWSAMMKACTQNGHGKDALNLFHLMQVEGINADKITFVCALDACASLAALGEGQKIHAVIIDHGYDRDDVVGNALLNMYGKCGHLDVSWFVFCGMPQRGVLSWTAMIGACAQNGHDNEALNLFTRMQLEGVAPNKITFTCVLNACSHIGQVEEARHYFVSMNRDHGIRYSLDHYVCMIDLLGHAGHLEEAEELVNMMPIENAASAWSSLLAACRFHGDFNRGLRAANNYLDLEPTSASPYILLSNIYAAAGRRDALANEEEVE